MRHNKLIICILSLLLFVFGISPVMADAPINGSTDHVLLFLPRSVTYDSSKAIDLSKAAELTSISNNPLVFNSESTKNLSIFRLYDTLDNRFKSVPTWDGYKRSDYSTYSYADMFQSNNSVTIRIHTTGVFVHTEDPGSTRDFSLSCILSEATIKQNGSGYELRSNDGKVNFVMTPGTTYNLVDGVNQTWFRSLGNGDYELYVPSTPTVSASNTGYYFPLLLRLFDICIKLIDPQPGESLEPGYYSTTITVQTTSTYTNTLWKGTKTGNTIDNEVLTMNMSETITVYGYIGDHSEPLETHQLTVSSASDTFSMNLGNTENLYNVAKIDFHSTDTLKSNTDSDIAPNPNDSAKVLARANYYKIYITPTLFTSSNADYGSYLFRKVTNPSETIEYDLYMQTKNGDVQLTGTNSQTASYINCEPNPYVSNNYSAIFPDSVVIQSVTVNGNVVCLTPKFAVNRETYQGSNITTYIESWNLSNFNLYVKSKYTSQSSGQYTSNIYVTLVAN